MGSKQQGGQQGGPSTACYGRMHMHAAHPRHRLGSAYVAPCFQLVLTPAPCAAAGRMNAGRARHVNTLTIAAKNRIQARAHPCPIRSGWAGASQSASALPRPHHNSPRLSRRYVSDCMRPCSDASCSREKQRQLRQQGFQLQATGARPPRAAHRQQRCTLGCSHGDF